MLSERLDQLVSNTEHSMYTLIYTKVEGRGWWSVHSVARDIIDCFDDAMGTIRGTTNRIRFQLSRSISEERRDPASR